MRAPWLALAVLAFVSLLSGCETGDDDLTIVVAYRNVTTIDLYLQVEGQAFVISKARSDTAVGYDMQMDDPFRLEITDPDGCLVYSLDTTPRDLQTEYGPTITIREEDVAHCAP